MALSLFSGIVKFWAAMKVFLAFILGVMYCGFGVVSPAENVPVEFTSLSVQILPSTAEDAIGFDWNMALSSVGDINSVNHELMLATQDHGFSHESFFVFENPFEFEPFVVPLVLDVPPFADVNDNGIDDFYDVSRPVDGIRTQGQHRDGNNRPVNFTATWMRSAGESAGSVVLDLPSLGLTFQTSFQLLRYVGDFSFQRTTNGLLEGTLSVTNALESQDFIHGPLSVRVLNTNTLSYTAVNWTNQGGAIYNIQTNIDLGLERTNFVSYWLLEDGYAPTGDFDYIDWIMVVSSGDTNSNGRIDLTEGVSTPTERPRLEIVRLPGGGLEVTIQGTPGQTYVLESANAIVGSTWQTSQSITLSSASQTISISGTGSRRFFRLRQ